MQKGFLLGAVIGLVILANVTGLVLITRVKPKLEELEARIERLEPKQMAHTRTGKEYEEFWQQIFGK